MIRSDFGRISADGGEQIRKQDNREEIDIIGSADKNTALFGECKWRNESVDLGVLETLVERSKLFNFDKKHFYIFQSPVYKWLH